MAFFAALSLIHSAPVFDPDLPILRIKGDGNITSNDIKTNTAYKSIEIIYIQGNITGLGDSALTSVVNLKEVYIESSKFTSIGKSVFQGCKSLEKATFPESLTYLSECLFQECSSLINVTFSSLLNLCSSLQSIDLPKSLKSIPTSCFRSCSSIKSIVLPPNVESLDEYSFSGCKSLTSFSVNNNLKYIKEKCFMSCVNLKQLELNNGLISIEGNAFYNCQALKSFTFPKTVSNIGVGILGSTNSLLFINVNPQNDYFANDDQGILYTKNLSILLQAPGAIKKVIIPSSVTEIQQFAFGESKYLESVVIPDSVLRINEKSFDYCISLKSLIIGSGIKELPKYAFNAPNLKVFNTGNGIEIIPQNSLVYLTGITTIIIGPNVKQIDQGAFAASAPVTNITINNRNLNFATSDLILYSLSNGVQNGIIFISIKANRLNISKDMTNINIDLIRMSNLSDISVADGHSKYCGNNGILYNALNDTVLAIPGGITETEFHIGTKYIGEKAGYGCKLRTVIFHEGLLRLEKQCLQYSNIVSLEFPSSLQYVGDQALQYCDSLEEVIFHSKELILGVDMFHYDKKLSNIQFDNDCILKELPKHSFNSCNFKKLIIPKGCKSFGSCCFINSKIETIVMKDSFLQSIGDSCFKNSMLSEFVIPKEVRILYASTFENTPLFSITFEKGSKLETIHSNAFADTNIDSIEFPASVKTLSENSFLNCINLVSVKLPLENNLTTIQQYCFANCRKLSTIDLGLQSKIEVLLPALFEKCYALKSIRIPNSVENIRSQAFFSCSALKTITISMESELVEIGERAFDGCIMLEAISIPPKVQRICTAAFNGDSGLLYLNFTEDSNCSVIETNAFLGCTSLAAVSFPASIESIGAKAFETCGSLASIEFADECKLKIIAANTFYGCSNLKSLEIPVSVEGVESGAFNSCMNLRSIKFAEGSKVEHIDESAFFGCINLQSVEFGSNSHLREVRTSAFSGCRNLEAIVFPPSLEMIGSRAFETCERLRQITLPDDCNLSLIKDGAFTGCTALESIRVPSKVKSIEKGSFGGCVSLSSVYFAPGSQLSAISSLIFSGCTALEQISFEEKEGYDTLLKTVETDGFNGCTKLSILVLPGSVTSIESYAFRGCTSLADLRFVGTPHLSEISSFVFSGCTSLISFTLPISVKAIRSNGFSDCENIQNIIFSSDSNIQEIDSDSFAGCHNLVSLILPKSLSQIHPGAFFDCPNLTNISISDGNTFYTSNGTTVFNKGFKELVGWPSARGDIKIDERTERIFSRAFEGLPITNIVLNNVHLIGDSAFEGCPLLLVNLSSVQSFGNRSFAECNELTVTDLGEIESVGDFAFSNVKRVPIHIRFSRKLSYLGESSFEGLEVKTFVYCGNEKFMNSMFGKFNRKGVKIVVKEMYPYDEFGGVLVSRVLNEACEYETAAYISSDSKSILMISMASLIDDDYSSSSK